MISVLLVGLMRAAQGASVAFAQTTTSGGNIDTHQRDGYTLPNPLGTDSFLEVINRVLQGLTIIAIPVVAIIIVIAGFMLITSGGDPGKRTKAKDMILWSAIGFGILLLADSVALIVQNFLSN